MGQIFRWHSERLTEGVVDFSCDPRQVHAPRDQGNLGGGKLTGGWGRGRYRRAGWIHAKDRNIQSYILEKTLGKGHCGCHSSNQIARPPVATIIPVDAQSAEPDDHIVHIPYRICPPLFFVPFPIF